MDKVGGLKNGREERETERERERDRERQREREERERERENQPQKEVSTFYGRESSSSLPRTCFLFHFPPSSSEKNLGIQLRRNPALSIHQCPPSPPLSSLAHKSGLSFPSSLQVGREIIGTRMKDKKMRR